MFFRSFHLLVFLAAATICSAQDRRDSTVVLGEVVVVDSLDRENRDATLRVSALGLDRLALRSSETVADLLGAEGFLHVRRAGPTGIATASLRGAGAAHTQVVLDGMYLTDPQSGQVDLTSIPASFIESVKVGHGGSYSVSAKSSLGGTIVLQTLRARSSPFYRLSVSGGAYGRRQIGFAASQPLGAWRTLLAADGSMFDGLFPYRQSGGGSELREREGADRSAAHAYARAERDLASGSLFVAAWISAVERGVPGPSNAPPVSARQRDRMVRFWAGHRVAIPDGSLNTRLSYTRSEISFDQPDPVGSTHVATQVLELSSAGTRVVSSTWLLDLTGAVGLEQSELLGGVQHLKGRMRASATRTSTGLSFHPALGLEWFDTTGGSSVAVLPSVSLAVSTPGPLTMTTKASAGRVLRVPTFNDRYWLPGGNPDLKPEFGWSADWGIQAEAGDRIHASVESTLFLSLLEDKIVWHPALSNSVIQAWRPSNVGRVLGRGLETSVAIEWRLTETALVEFKTVYTYARVEDRSDSMTRSYGHQLRYSPEHVIKSVLSAGFDGYGIETVLHVTGPQYITSDESQTLASNTDMSVRLWARRSMAGGALRLQLSIENAADDQLASMRFYPMPPRHLRFSILYETEIRRANHD